jgi:hypothetical protein
MATSERLLLGHEFWKQPYRPEDYDACHYMTDPPRECLKPRAAHYAAEPAAPEPNKYADYCRGWSAAELGRPRDDAEPVAWHNGWEHWRALAERDALKADLARVSVEMGLPPSVGQAPGELRRFMRERREWLAEVQRLKADHELLAAQHAAVANERDALRATVAKLVMERDDARLHLARTADRELLLLAERQALEAEIAFLEETSEWT